MVVVVTLEIRRGGMLQDFVSSVSYYAEVVEFEAQDPDFTAAHRACAFFESYQICFVLAAVAFTMLTLPSLLVAATEIVSGALVLLSQAGSAQDDAQY